MLMSHIEEFQLKYAGLFALRLPLCVVALLTCPAINSAEQSPPVHITYLVLDEKAEPLQIVQSKSDTRGIISDIVAAIFDGSRYQVEASVLPVNRMHDEVRKGRITDWVAYDAPIWDSFEQHGEMSAQPLFMTSHVLLTCNPTLPSRVETVEELEGMAIVTMRHFKYPGFTEAMESGTIRSVPVERFDAGLKLVSTQSADGFLEMNSRLSYHLKTFTGNAGCFRKVDVSSIIPRFPIFLSYDRNLPAETKQLINERLLEMGGAGELEAIRRRYVPDPTL